MNIFQTLISLKFLSFNKNYTWNRVVENIGNKFPQNDYGSELWRCNKCRKIVKFTKFSYLCFVNSKKEKVERQLTFSEIKLIFHDFHFSSKQHLSEMIKEIKCYFCKKSVLLILHFVFFSLQGFDKIVKSSFYSKNMLQHEKTFFRQKLVLHLSYECITLTKFFNFSRFSKDKFCFTFQTIFCY